MSRISEALLKKLVTAANKKSSPNKQSGESFDSYFQWQFDTSARLFNLYPNFSPAGKTILEIGCGTGGRTAYLASIAERVVGIDINHEEIELAQSLCKKWKPELADKVSYVKSTENSLVEIGQFDMVLLVDSMEHIVSPPAILKIANQYTKPGGQCFFNTMGWYHHKGSHTGLLPWVNVLFSDETIINVIRWKISQPEYIPTRFDSSPPIERWRGIYNLRDRPGEHLNKITLSEIKKIVKYTDHFSYAKMTVIPFQTKHPVAKLFNAFGNIPLLQEMFHSGVVVEFRK